MIKLKYYAYLWMARTAMFLMYALQSIRQILTIMPSNQKTIIFYLEEEAPYRDDDGRYPYSLVSRFSRAGYNVYLYKSIRTFRQYLKLGKYGRYMYSLPNFKFIASIPNSMPVLDTYFAFDRFNSELFNHRWKKLIYVNIHRSTHCQIGTVVPIPYFFHPIANKINIHKKVRELRQKNRGLKIIFAGNTSKEWYSVKKLRDWYGKIPRHEAVQAVLQLGDRVKNIKDSKGFCQSIAKENYMNDCCLLRTDIASKLNLEDYWGLISKSDFFLGLSGTDYPMCHNVIESMSVGTIPILGYGEWFTPPLEHGKNAILYADEEDLRAKILEVLDMDSQAIQAMRQNVLKYNDEHLANSKFIEKVELSREALITIMLLPRLVCTPEEGKAGKEFAAELKEKVMVRSEQNQPHKMEAIKT